MIRIERALLVLSLVTLYPLNAWADPCKTGERAAEARAELAKADSIPVARALSAAAKTARNAYETE